MKFINLEITYIEQEPPAVRKYETYFFAIDQVKENFWVHYSKRP
jgi:hypothetical protein